MTSIGLFLLALTVTASGGFVTRVGSLVISARSPWRAWWLTIGLIVVRHAIVARPALPERFVGWTRGAGSRLRALFIEDPAVLAMRAPRMDSRSLRSYRPDIDGLRAVAVAAVIAFHAAPAWVRGGFVGVDVFFVISGFLISSIIISGLRGRFSVAEFYARRVRRIFPALALVLAAVWVTGWIILLPEPFQQLGRHTAGGAGFVANLVLWREAGYFDAAAEQKPLLHLWSLGVEEQFYLVWPALLILCSKRRLRLVPVLAVVALASFLLNVGSVGGHATAAFYLPLTRLWELAAGGLLAAAIGTPDGGRARDVPALVRHAASIGGLAIIFVSTLIIDGSRPFPGWWALLPALGTVLIIVAGDDAWSNRYVLSHPALVFVGLISYPLYLWHWPLLTYARIVSADGSGGTAVALALGTAFALSWATYTWVERPVRRAIPRFRSAAIAGSIAGLTTIGLAGLWTVEARGVPGRFDAALKPVATFSYDYGVAYRADRCFLTEGESAAQFRPECVDPRSGAAPTVLLWGDSHAAHLYPGLMALQRTRPFRIAQFTATGCPPMAVVERSRLTPDRPECPAINAYIADMIPRLRPATVILSAAWAWYPDRSPLDATVALVRHAGVQRVVLVGPVPNWTESLPQVLVAAFERDPLHRIPQRTSAKLVRDTVDVDRELRATAGRLGVAYVSPLEILCDRNGCLTRASDRTDDLMAWDGSHLTSDGSALLMTAAAGTIFGERPPGIPGVN